MAAPAWLTGIFAALMLTVAVYCVGRLVAARRWRRPTEVDTDVGHVLMGVAMAGMLVARLRVLPAAAWEAVLAVGAAWFACAANCGPAAAPRPARGAACTRLPHLVECAAMLYMFAVPAAFAGRRTAPAPGRMAAMTRRPGPAPRSWLCCWRCSCSATWPGSLTACRCAPPPPRRPWASPATLAPRCAALCKIAMALTMGYMLS